MGDSEGSNQEGVSYTVQAGDTLSKLAKEFYGDDSQYKRIFEANRDKLKDADSIRVGQELIIPPATS
jgi:nucleoid-associated protein YgaU